MRQHTQRKLPKEPERALRIDALKPILAKYENNGGGLILTPAVNRISHRYIRDISERAYKDIDDGEFDSALTKAKTLLEEVFCYVLERKGIAKSKNEDIFSLYNKAKTALGMRQNSDYDKRVNSLLSGLEKILQAISEMRNAQSDAHGVGSTRINIKCHHARLFVNAAQTMADFVLSVVEGSEVK